MNENTLSGSPCRNGPTVELPLLPMLKVAPSPPASLSPGRARRTKHTGHTKQDSRVKFNYSSLLFVDFRPLPGKTWPQDRSQGVRRQIWCRLTPSKLTRKPILRTRRGRVLAQSPHRGHRTYEVTNLVIAVASLRLSFDFLVCPSPGPQSYPKTLRGGSGATKLTLISKYS